MCYRLPLTNEEEAMAESQATKLKIELTMYGVTEILKWCVSENKGRIPGVDTEVFKQMQAAVDEKPKAGDYFTFDQFWKKSRIFEFTKEEVETVDRCLYDIPNFEGKQLPQIRYKFWPAKAE